MMKPEIRPGQIWRHFKGGDYRVLHLATHSETGDKLVIYTKDGGDVTVWARPVSMWLEVVERNGKSQPRFALIFNAPQKEGTTNFCADCLWYESEQMYCFRQGNHSYDNVNCELWEPNTELPKEET